MQIWLGVGQHMIKHPIGIAIQQWFAASHAEVFEMWIQFRPPRPKCIHIRIDFAMGNNSAFAGEVIWMVMRSAGGICSMLSDFFGPGTRKLWTTIGASEIASGIEVDFHITRYHIFIAGAGLYLS